MKYISVAFHILLLFSATPTAAQPEESQSCITPDNNYGTCVPLSYCPKVVLIYRATSQDLARSYVIGLNRSCGTRSINRDPFVCCSYAINDQQEERSQANPFHPPMEPTLVSSRPGESMVSQNPLISTQPRSNKEKETTIRTISPVPVETVTPVIDSRGSTCRGPDNQPGNCLEIKSCPALLTQLTARRGDENFF